MFSGPFTLRSDEPVPRSEIPEEPQPTKGTIEDAYPLSPMQQGMLFHSLLAPDSGVDIEQVLCELHEALDVAAFKRSWQCAIKRHPILRTKFSWQGVDQPRQEVHSVAELPWDEQDWRNVPLDEKKDRLAAFLISDRRRGFNMSQAPLFRLSLFHWDTADSRLIRTFHHTLLDGRALIQLLRELFAFYEAFRSGTELELHRPRPYRDYIDWLQQQDFSKAEPFWRKTLKGFSAPTPLVIDHRAALAGNDGTHQADQVVWLSSEITTSLRTLAEENELTLNTIVQGAWALLLNRYSGQDDVVFGGTRACRRSTVEGADEMVGVFINTLPLRVRVNPESELLPWLKALRAQWMAMRDHEHTPLVKVQSWGEAPAGSSLFDSIVVFENFHLDTQLRALGGSWSNRHFRLFEKTNYPITLAAYAETELCLKIGFDLSRFDDATIGRMLAHLQTLLEAMACQPQSRLCDLQLLTPAERRQLLVEWNDTAVADGDDRREVTLSELIEAQASRTPDAAAVVCQGMKLSYRELDQRANQLALHLQRLGVTADTPVGICLERSFEAVVGILGTLKATGAYVPLDPQSPPERLRLILADCRAPLVLASEKTLPALAGVPACTVCLDTEWDEIALLDSTPRPRQKSSENLAYILYTSGSMGTPKGVLVSQDSIVGSTQARFAYYGAVPERFLLFPSLAFDSSVAVLFWTLGQGGTLILPSDEEQRDVGQLAELVRRHRVTHWLSVPSAYTMLLNLAKPESLDSLRVVIVAGETCSGQLFQRHHKLLPGAKFYNEYGPTEASVWSTVYRAAACDLSLAVSLPIGRPIQNMRTYVLDPQGRPVPVGVPGELYLAGAGLARGYLNQSELTDSCFLPDPFTERPNAQMYRTGDQVRWRADGNLEFLGRLDHQVKLRGFRIELGEVEAVLMQHPQVRQAVVLLREDRPGDTRLVAYLVSPSATAPPAAAELRRQLHERLPNYMIPSAFVFLDTLPLTPNGKIDRQALPAPEREPVESKYAAPRNAVEESLASIWSEVLGIKQVGIHDNFFALGGHSLLAVRLCAEIENKLGCRIPLALFLGSPNIEVLADAISKEPSSQCRIAVVPLKSSGTQSPLFIMPSISGTPLTWKHVLNCMDTERPVFAVGMAGQTPPWPEQVTLPEIASHFVAALRDVRVIGPLHIMGYSFGGMLAYEVARQLHDAGIEVGVVAVVDTGPEQLRAHARWPDIRNLPRLLANAPAWMSGFVFQTTTSHKLNELRRKLRAWRRRLQASLCMRPAIDHLDEALDTRRLPSDLRRRMQTNYRAMQCYVPGAYSGRLVLFRAKIRPLLHSLTPDLRWRQVVSGRVEIVDIPGNHDTIFRQPNSDTLAAHLQAVLNTD